MAQFACFECLRIALVEANKKSTKTLVKYARRAGWLQQEGPRGGRGCGRGEEAHFGPELVDVPWLAGPGCASTLDLRPSPCSLQSPFAVPSPLVELFPPPTSALRAFPLFPQHRSSAPRPRPQPRAATLKATYTDEIPRSASCFTRPQPATAQQHQPCMLTASFPPERPPNPDLSPPNPPRIATGGHNTGLGTPQRVSIAHTTAFDGRTRAIP
jgi:hypothetical protein